MRRLARDGLPPLRRFPGAAALALLSRTLIPAANLFFSLVFLPVVVLTGKAKGRI